ncbi:hypothetical protein RRG08_065790 [Elysia crispata]|uniref:Uncharacterized protein n=1 Tax=Elysia crispata TaxID=231223 RepID=A0AAE0ZSG4_9GAST|nr:hypothetical protein RRG08_065790 [Elysia crispata]
MLCQCSKSAPQTDAAGLLRTSRGPQLGQGPHQDNIPLALCYQLTMDSPAIERLAARTARWDRVIRKWF